MSAPRTLVIVLCAFLVPVALATANRAADAPDPGLSLQLDAARFELVAIDLRTGQRSDPIPVALGSPAQPTPSGVFELERVVLNPGWVPGPRARRAGAEVLAASLDTPMGAAKIPFASRGAIALHGGGDPRLLGKPVSGGCVRASDADLLRLIAWLDGQDGLAAARPQADGEIVRALVRPARLLVF